AGPPGELLHDPERQYEAAVLERVTRVEEAGDPEPAPADGHRPSNTEMTRAGPRIADEGLGAVGLPALRDHEPLGRELAAGEPEDQARVRHVQVDPPGRGDARHARDPACQA